MVYLRYLAAGRFNFILPNIHHNYVSGISNGGRRVVKALCAYTARAESDISFRKGDKMEVLNDAEPDWWRVLHLTTRREGLVPVNFVAEESSVECEE